MLFCSCFCCHQADNKRNEQSKEKSWLLSRLRDLDDRKNRLQRQLKDLNRKNELEVVARQYDINTLRISELEKIEKDLDIIEFYQARKLAKNEYFR